MKIHAQQNTDRVDADQGRAMDGSISSSGALPPRAKRRGFSKSSRERWKVGANGALDRGSSDIPCAVCGIARRIFKHGLIVSRSRPNSRDCGLTPSFGRWCAL